MRTFDFPSLTLEKLSLPACGQRKVGRLVQSVQAIHVQVTTLAPFRVRDVTRPGCHKHQRTLAIRVGSHAPCPSTNLSHDRLQHFVAATLCPMFSGKRHVRQRLLRTIGETFGGSGKPQRTNFLDSWNAPETWSRVMKVGIGLLNHIRCAANSAGLSPLSELWGRRWLYVDLHCPITCCASASVLNASQDKHSSRNRLWKLST